MDTRKIYYIYENVEREINPIIHRISQNDFKVLLIRELEDHPEYGINTPYAGLDTLYIPREITDFVDEFYISGFSGDYFHSPGGQYFVRGDVLVINEAICPDNMTKEEFNALSMKELVEKIDNGEIEEQDYDFISSHVPVNIDENISVEFKPVFNGIRMLVNNNVDTWFYDNKDYKLDVEIAFDYCDELSIEEIDENEIMEEAIDSFADSIENDFQTTETFIVSDDIREQYKKAIKNDLKKSFDNYLEERKIKENYYEQSEEIKKGGIKR